MNYTEEFKARCKKAYPDFPKLHKALEEGSIEVGYYLDHESGISYDEILAATSLEELKAKALLIKEKCDLYEDYENGNCLQTKADLYKIMRDLFQQTVSNDNLSISYSEFYKKALVENSAEFLALQKHLLENNASFDNIVVQICFKEVQQEFMDKSDNINHTNTNLYVFMTNVFNHISKLGFDDFLAYSTPSEFYEFVSTSKNVSFKALQVLLQQTDTTSKDDMFVECFNKVKDNYLKEHPKEKQATSVDNLISRATAISEQSKGLADDLGKLKEDFVIE